MCFSGIPVRIGESGRDVKEVNSMTKWNTHFPFFFPLESMAINRRLTVLWRENKLDIVKVSSLIHEVKGYTIGA